MKYYLETLKGTYYNTGRGIKLVNILTETLTVKTMSPAKDCKGYIWKKKGVSKGWDQNPFFYGQYPLPVPTARRAISR